uniref:Scavenger receptor class B member 2 n=1 Tax=Salvator merianae TaxID=96440 RepID=A0A8D0BHP2_SALMN
MRKVCLGAVGALSMVFLVVGISLLVARVLEKAVDGQVRQNIVLKNGTDVFEAWKDPPPPIHMQFYFFNYTNPLEILQGETPLVKQVGPYTYREYSSRIDVHIIDNGTKVTFFHPKTYVFVPEMSVGDPEVDLIRSVNMPALMAMDMATATPFHIPAEILLILYEENLFLMRTVHELLWGYRDKLLTALHKFHSEIDPEFGYYYKMNGTSDGEYVVLSGKKSYLDFSRIVEWNGKSSLNWWTSSICNMINGTDGESFHPLLGTDDTIYIFSSDFCRSLYLTFDRYVTVEGIPAYRFVPPKKIFENATVNPDNAGFCVPAGNCLGAGLLNVSACKRGAPIFLSPPHFYESDEKYLNDIEGLHPNKEDHETFLDISPLTGILLRANKRMQVNARVQKLPDFVQTGNIRTIYLPVLYINESVAIDKASAGKLKTLLLESSVITSIPFVIMAVGLILGLVFTVFVCRPLQAREEGREVLIEPE